MGLERHLWLFGYPLLYFLHCDYFVFKSVHTNNINMLFFKNKIGKATIAFKIPIQLPLLSSEETVNRPLPSYLHTRMCNSALCPTQQFTLTSSPSLFLYSPSLFFTAEFFSVDWQDLFKSFLQWRTCSFVYNCTITCKLYQTSLLCVINALHKKLVVHREYIFLFF